ncbi:hypothetical protein [Nonomuraea sp. NPDC050783]|uniref:hypothetical protein n=1 Tax=Nonomuraea sp. NPDC050783 TaxID=3154634 RepID=UPI003465FB0D
MQVLPLVGVVLGALMSYAAGALAERARHKRELRNRWDGRELDAYIDYLGTIAVMARIAGQVAGLRGYDPLAARPRDEAQGLMALDNSE